MRPRNSTRTWAPKPTCELALVFRQRPTGKLGRSLFDQTATTTSTVLSYKYPHTLLLLPPYSQSCLPWPQAPKVVPSASKQCSLKSWRLFINLYAVLSARRVIHLPCIAKQQLEISELRQETHELRQANASLERQVKEGLQVSSNTKPTPYTCTCTFGRYTCGSMNYYTPQCYSACLLYVSAYGEKSRS